LRLLVHAVVLHPRMERRTSRRLCAMTPMVLELTRLGWWDCDSVLTPESFARTFTLELTRIGRWNCDVWARPPISPQSWAVSVGIDQVWTVGLQPFLRRADLTGCRLQFGIDQVGDSGIATAAMSGASVPSVVVGIDQLRTVGLRQQQQRHGGHDRSSLELTRSRRWDCDGMWMIWLTSRSEGTL